MGTEIVPSKIVPIDSIRPNAWNPNVMDEEKFLLLKESLKTFGFCQAVITLPDGTIIDGEQRWKAMREEGATEIEIKEIDVDTLVAMEGTVNFNLIKGVFDKKRLGDLILQIEADKGREYVRERLALEKKAYDAAIARAQAEGQRQPETPIDSAAVDTDIIAGDIFKLGKHILVCGDSSDTDVVKLAFSNHKTFSLMVTDPPYNVCEIANVDFYNENNSLSIKRLNQQGWDEGFDPKMFLDVALDYADPDSTWYVFTSHMLAPEIWEWMRGYLDTDNFCVWCKPNPMPNLSQKYYGSAVELICYGTKGKPVFNVGKGVDPNYFIVNKGTRALHPSEKPTGIIEPLIIHSSTPESVVFDPFGGSGTTLIVCEDLGRKCVCIEKDPKYVQTIINRWKSFTGKEVKKLNG